MYTTHQYTTAVHDGTARYGEGPLPAEEFAGAGALNDLSRAETTDVPLILARYAALRAWLLATTGVGGPVATHAMMAALEHLAATAEDGTEPDLLRAALAAGDGGPGLELLERAGRAAAARGHEHGAHALREAVRRTRAWKGRCPPPSPS